MKKAMTILLTFIMVLQLIPIPAFATEEIATAEDLKAFLENPENVTVAEGSTLTVQISAENKLTKVSVFCDGEVRIKKDVTIPSAVKLQIPAATLYFHVDSTITVFGCIQDGRAVADRANGIVGEGDGKVVFTNGSVYFQQGVTMINTSNTKLKLADDDSTITMYKNGHMMISSGTVNLNSVLTTDHFKKITVAVDAIFNDGGYVDAGIEFTTVSNHGGVLDEDIEKAEKLLAFVSVSSDGSDIDSDSLWVTQAAHDTYSAAIVAAQTAAETGDDDVIIAAIEALQEATFRFHAEKEQGGADIGTLTTYQELLDALNAIQDGCAVYKGEEDYGDQHYEVIQITKPITIDQVITVPYPIKLQFNADITINGRIIIEGYLQDMYLSAYGIFGKEGVGDVLFNPNTWMYIKGKGGVVGTTSGTWVKDGAEMLLVGDHGMIIKEGEVEVVTALYSDIAEQVYCMENTGITLSSGINEAASIDASNAGVKFVYCGIENTKNILGNEAVSVSCLDNAVSVVLEDGRIEITVNEKENAGNAEIVFTDVNGGFGTVEIVYAKGAITSAKVTRIGFLTTNQAKELIAELKAELQSLMEEAQTNGLDTQREEAVLWFAQYFEKCADWDEANMTIVKDQYHQSAVYGYNADALAEQLPMYERKQVIEMLEDAISELQDVIDGKIIRPGVVKVDWDNLTIQGDQVYNPDGTPVFLYDYFSKAQNGDQSDRELYNDYLGNIVHPISQSLQYLTEDGKLSNNATAQNINFYDYYGIEENVGYQFLWHSGTVLPAWVTNLYGDEITIGGENYTVYDIDNPNVREMWEQIFEMLIPQIEDSNTTQLGYILANEPHWFTDASASFNVTGISQYTSAKFEAWLAETYGTVEALNTNWGTEYASFDDVDMQVPTDLESLRGTPKYYDWCRFNMDRVNDWFQFLHDGITEFDEDATTHIKIFPRIVVDENGQRDHGIDIEYLTSLTEYNGNDVTIRKRLPNATSDEWWEENYIYDWRELAMTYAMLDSFNPDTLNVNSESHFLNGNAYADMYTTTQYTRSVYWLSAMLGNNVNMTWWWPRYGDGSIEPRLQTSQMGKTFAGSVATMPLVANEITQTFFDLNSVSDTIVKFQRQDMPIRVLYSETACIVDADQINRTFEMFEALYFEGTSIGFASENVINLYGDTFSQILIYDTTCVTDEEFAALQNFLDNGGTIIMDDVSLTMNQYKEERAERLEASNGTLVVMQNGTVEDMSAKAFEMLDKEKKSDVVLSESNDAGTKTCIWRVAEGKSADERVISIVNVGQETATLTLNGYDIENMLTGEKLENSFAIEAEGVLLLRFTLDEDTTDDDENLEVSNREAADAVAVMIEAIGTVTHDSVCAIEAAREAYDALTEEQKALVKNYHLLCAAEEELAALQQGQSMYYAWLEANEPDVAVGESIALHVEVRGTGYTDYASSEIVISYDNAVLTFDEFGSNLYGATIVNNDGTLTLEDFGESQSFGTGYVISFNANAEGEGTVTLTSAAFSTQANAANSDLISAVLQDTTVTIVATMYHSVDLPNIFIGADSVSSGEDYTFAPADRENYDYSDVTATMDGEPVEVTKNGDGSYTVENVT